MKYDEYDDDIEALLLTREFARNKCYECGAVGGYHHPDCPESLEYEEEWTSTKNSLD